jgi:hypothetical protein
VLFRSPKALRENVYAWLSLLPNLRGDPKKLRKQFADLLDEKIARGLR